MNSLVCYELSSGDEEDEDVIASMVDSLMDRVSFLPPRSIKEEPLDYDSDFGWRIDKAIITSDSSGEDEMDEAVSAVKKHRRKLKKQPCSSEDDSDEDAIFHKAMEFTRQNRLRRLGRPDSETLNSQVRPLPQTRGELSLSDLPPIEQLSLYFDHPVQLMKLGVVSSAVDTLVVIKSEQGLPALDENSVVFLNNCVETPLGRVFETFGPVARPMYSVRFNDPQEIKDLELIPGETHVFFAPREEEVTKTVFTDALRKLKGSDASWKEDNEPPPEVLEFSDDEEERRIKAAKKRIKQQGSSRDEMRDEVLEIATSQQQRGRGRKRRGGERNHLGFTMHPSFDRVQGTSFQLPPFDPWTFRPNPPQWAFQNPPFPQWPGQNGPYHPNSFGPFQNRGGRGRF